MRNPTHLSVTNATFTSGCVHGHRAWFHQFVLRSVLASFKCRPSLAALRPTPALRSSISSEGSLLFVVCPSRISTHSVSSETHIINPSLPPSLSLSRRCISSHHAVSRKTKAIKRHYRLGGTRGNQNGDSVDRARPLHHSVQSARISHEISFLSFLQTPLRMQSRVQTMTSRTVSCI